MKLIERFGMPVAVHLILEKDGLILLLRRSNTGYEDGKWSLPAGHVEASEAATTAMKREASEELGIHVSKLCFAHIMHKKDPVDGQERVDFFFRSSTWEGTLKNCEPHKCSELGWYTPNALPHDIIEYVRSAIQASIRQRTFSEFGWW